VQLRQSQDEIFKKKEELLQKQIEQYHSLIAKVAAQGDTDASRAAIETYESKLLDVQSKLRALEEDKARTTAAPATATATTSSFAAAPARGRGPPGRFDAGRGRGRGRFAARGGGPSSFSFDGRPKTLVVSNAPAGFEAHAMQHFSRSSNRTHSCDIEPCLIIPSL
jgi:hypothetical protein